jgi:hypothetical protein
LHMAFDYLAFTRFEDVPRSSQLQALCLIEDARLEYDRNHERTLAQRVRTAGHRVRGWFADFAPRSRKGIDRRDGNPFGRPLLPA